jgi:hypothetical protein
MTIDMFFLCLKSMNSRVKRLSTYIQTYSYIFDKIISKFYEKKKKFKSKVLIIKLFILKKKSLNIA